MGSVEPRFAVTLRGDLWEDIFGADCLHLMDSESGWGVYEEGQWAEGTAGGSGDSEVCVFLLVGICLPVWCFCSPVGKSTAVSGAGLPDAPLGCVVLLSFFDLITEVGRGWQGAEDAL